ncbi:hypothetical protein L6452_03993 [Arctium lappa]|uniref:Uncharacterized protein n=1 Tax=Arctium lappa TaxID=4217 RepID=A0ACB9FNE9_ARCLA|nr:hypothetical protein L6452_03993 [Arctium lappa]
MNQQAILKSFVDLQSVSECVALDIYSPNATGLSSTNDISFTGPESAQSVPASNLAPPALLQFAKTRKLSVERSDPRKAQPMALEQVFAEQDSEDEVDDDVVDLEHRRICSSVSL